MNVSVITTLYNYKHYIGDCIESFVIQDFPDIEMLIVDDGSDDNPYDIVKNFMKKGNIQYIKLGKNYGYSYAKNIGIEKSKSEILVMLDADDMLTENSLRIRYEKIKEGYDFVHGPVMDLRSCGLVQSRLWKKWLKSKKDPSSYKFVHAQSVMLRKNIHRKIGLYDENLRCKSDREMWARIFNHNFKIGWVNEPVSIYRIHASQMHKSKEKSKINDKLQEQVLEIISRRSKNIGDVKMLKDIRS